MTNTQIIKSICNKKYGWLCSGNGLNFSKSFGVKKMKIISFSLRWIDSKLYIFPVNYIFNNKISHFVINESYDKLYREFGFTGSNYRITLNQTYLFSIVNMLKETNLWSIIANQDFLSINNLNKNNDNDKVKTNLKNLIFFY